PARASSLSTSAGLYRSVPTVQRTGSQPRGGEMPSGVPAEGGRTGGPVPGAGYALALLLGINLFNYIDRQILSATLPKIQLDAGLVLGTLCFFMREPRRHTTAERDKQQPAAEWHAIPEPPAPSYPAVLKELRGIRSFVLCCAGMTLSTFVLGGVAAWAPVYIFEREARFEVRPETVAKLESLRLSNGEPVIPEKVLAEVRGMVSPDVLTVAEFRGKLKD